MICLTGDIHHLTLKTLDQQYLSDSEADVASKYIEIAEYYSIKTTLFLTGKVVEEDKEAIIKLSGKKGIEFGGHTYAAFQPKLLYKLSYRFLGLHNGPRWLQANDIKKTIKVFKDHLNVKIRSWRNHAYRNDRNTPSLLLNNGIKCYSDIASPSYKKPFTKNGIVYVPINVLPDHDYMYHGNRRPGFFDETPLAKSNFKTTAMPPEKWLETVKKQVSEIVSAGGIATILAHPACMEIADGFVVFEQLCKFLSKFPSAHVCEMENYTC